MNEFLSWVTAGMVALFSFGSGPDAGFTGYLEADYIHAAPLSGGVIAEIGVREGQVVAAGDMLFRLVSDHQEAQLAAARARVAAAQATLNNLETGSRSEELAVIRASLDKARADLELARSSLARTERLYAAGTVSLVRLEQDQSTLQSTQAQVAQLQAELNVAELPARTAQQVAAEAELAAAEAMAQDAELDLADRTVLAPNNGTVETVYFAVGEMASAGMPVVSIIPQGEIKARFYVEEAARSQLALGDRVSVSCDGCASGITAEISYLASEPQTTPPVIYSREERARLVFLAEAVLDEPGNLLPGQPVSVEVIE